MPEQSLNTQAFKEPSVAKDWAERFITDLTVVRPPNTVRAYKQDLTRWLKFCETINVDPLTARPANVIEFIGFERQRVTRGTATVSARTIVRRLSAIRLWYSFLSLEPEHTGVHRNPVPSGSTLRTAAGNVAGMPALLRYDTSLPQVLSGDEMDRFIAQLNTHRDRAIVWLLKDGAMRIHEALDLRMDKIDWTGKRVAVRSTKGRNERVVQLSADAISALSNYIRLERPKDLDHDYAFVCLGRRSFGRPFRYRAWVYICEQARSRAETPGVHAHAFRHTQATNLAEAGMPLDSLQKQLGHRRSDSTLVYTEVRNGRLHREYQQAMEAHSRVRLPPAGGEESA